MQCLAKHRCADWATCTSVLSQRIVYTHTSIYSKLHLADTLVLLNKNGGLQFGLVEHSNGVQNLLDQKMP